MILRRLEATLRQSLERFPVVAILGPRQVGKTTLALSLREALPKKSLYLDLERDSDLNRLEEPELYLGRQKDRLVILDEIQRKPELFPLLRSLVDERLRAGERCGQFLILGSASPELLARSSESLAGRIAYHELTPFRLDELLDAVTGMEPLDLLWERGGFPLSFLAPDPETSWEWRRQFVFTYLERDFSRLGEGMPAERMRRFWAMLGFGQGNLLNAARLAASLGVSGHTIRAYLDLLTDLFMVRQLPPWSGNSSKRLVKSPKIYLRDSGILHYLTQIHDMELLLSHPLCGTSWEGFAIEQIATALSADWQCMFYRTSAQAEIDLVLEDSAGRIIACEIKRTLRPQVTRGFRNACEDIGADQRYFIIPEGELYPLDAHTEAIGLRKFLVQVVPTL
jgi:uncharacterized protein